MTSSERSCTIFGYLHQACGRRLRRSILARRRMSRVPQQFKILGARDVYRVKGDSMSAFGLRDGDVVYVRPLTRGNARSTVGRFVLVRLNGKLLLKQLIMRQFDDRAARDAEVLVGLRSGQPGYAPITIGRTDVCKPIGQVVASVRHFVE